MKKISTLTIASLLVVGAYSTPAQASDQVTTAICGYVESDHKSRLRDQLRSNKIKLKKVYNRISCDGQSLLRYAMVKDADSVGSFIAKRLSAKMLTTPEADGTTIYDWAQANGKGASATAGAIKDRAKL
ncbi:DUF3718 domain-containing protein [Psychrobium sp. 1_MG-2023]|uniref:DUF3718 domain-containing protein n=1 Tax=Psychrobium sp. 1_MG-2023 TaxID=3062624 RepID=UPI000C3301AA|nr:DUF3718 domain-containing protein [Psychrobium sp. 1_MG-2023]MDP2560852.1 DUF3718 domain-containing protein [Psychrobium sp. 1_MG-2023]PKF56726.1 hypothetical protein CW748_09615 [Alteromonadales bacterium alter-6D02]